MLSPRVCVRGKCMQRSDVIVLVVIFVGSINVRVLGDLLPPFLTLLMQSPTSDHLTFAVALSIDELAQLVVPKRFC